MKSCVLLLSFLCLAMQGFTQTPGQNKTVFLSATVQNNPPAITLSFPSGNGNTELYRKPLSGATWGSALAILPGGSSNWTDTNVAVGEGYEYRVVKPGSPNAYGYMYAGIELPEAMHRGKVLLVYDTISTAGLEPELARWKRDAEGDGWEVLPIAIDQNDAVTEVKAQIVTAWQADPQQVQAVYLFGRVPVPYSGNIAPDGHTPDHLGAWPADSYYAEMDGNWTDVSINNAGASQVRNQNIPGDGKFDQSTFPGNLELQIGRVDMRNLPAFSLSETELLRRYLDKNHAYRNKHFSTVNRALIDDNFGGFAEGFSGSAWRNFSVLCGANNIVTTDYFNTMKVEPYQWSYGCGGGSYTSCSGIGNTAAFAADSIQSIFTMLFGSYFGDWDSPSNNLLRAALANGSTLTNSWSGRPFWHFHQMGLGLPIGYSALQSMNNVITYDANNSQRGVHMALMGDPTLRAHILAPAHNLLASFDEGHTQLSWDASAEAVLGYNLYRRFGETGAFEKLNSEPVSDLSYVDSCVAEPGIYEYMVRSVALEVTNSGSFYNEGTGVFDTLSNPGFVPVANFESTQDANVVQFSNLSALATSYSWDFGDGNSSMEISPSHTYDESGDYLVTLIASNACFQDTSYLSLNVVITSTTALAASPDFTVFPNPSSGQVEVRLNSWTTTGVTLRVYDAQGQALFQQQLNSSQAMVDLSPYSAGLYIFSIESAAGIKAKHVLRQ